MTGEGSYALTGVKQMKVTEDFLGLNIDIRKCQNKETIEACTTKKYFEKLREKCQCVPYRLRNFTAENQVIPFFLSKVVVRYLLI